MAKKPVSTVKKLAIVIATEEVFHGMVNRYCQALAAITTANAQHDEEIACLNVAHDEAMQEQRDELSMLESSLHLYASCNRLTLFPEAGKKSREYANATVGFRDNPHSVAPMIKGEKDQTLALRLSQLDWGDPYMDWKPVLDKKQLLADRLKLTPEQLQSAGIKFVAEEQFYIAPNADTAPRVALPADQEVAA
jgi:hypothetical protein